MKRARYLLPLLLSAAVAAQTPNGMFGAVGGFGNITGTGPMAVSVAYTAGIPPASTYTLDWSYAGAAPSACSMQGEGSTDNVHWYNLTGTLDCTGPNMIHVIDKPVVYFRINVTSYTPGTGTVVTVRYTRGKNG